MPSCPPYHGELGQRRIHEAENPVGMDHLSSGGFRHVGWLHSSNSTQLRTLEFSFDHSNMRTACICGSRLSLYSRTRILVKDSHIQIKVL